MISVNELLVFLGVFFGACLITAICVLLIVALAAFIKMVRRVSRLIDDNAAPVGKTIKQLPALASDLDQAAAGVKLNADRIGTSFSVIEGAFAGGASEDSQDTVLTIVGIAENVLKLIMNYIANRDKEKG